MRRTFLWWFVGMFVAGIALRMLPFILDPHHAGASAAAAVPPDFWRAFAEHLAEGLGDALIIAAVLGFAVERYTQLRLATDVGQMIAERVYGYHLPEEIRKRLKEFNDFDFIVRDVVWHVEIRPAAQGNGMIHCRWSRNYEVQNAKPYKQRFHFETATKVQQIGSSDDSRIEEVAHYVNRRLAYHHQHGKRGYVDGYGEDGYGRKWRDKKGVVLPPCNANPRDIHTFCSVSSVTIEDGELREMGIVYPTSGVCVLIDIPEEYEVSSSMNLDRVPQTHPVGRPATLQWDSPNAYLPGHRFWIRVRSKRHGGSNGTAVVQAPAEAVASDGAVTPAV
ncbi:MAG: hypothetical protein QOJ39_2733 [Candidatus Eremiobacteraeota bacterium]|jgi:hypothetical protein|nr:hypothetical protein [Candidatus Eremiobacteraeota bacterium]